MTDIKLVQDEFGRDHPVKVEDLFQYGIESDGDTIATNVSKTKHFRVRQPLAGVGNNFSFNDPLAISIPLNLPDGAVVEKINVRYKNLFTLDGEHSPGSLLVFRNTISGYQAMLIVVMSYDNDESTYGGSPEPIVIGPSTQCDYDVPTEDAYSLDADAQMQFYVRVGTDGEDDGWADIIVHYTHPSVVFDSASTGWFLD